MAVLTNACDKRKILSERLGFDVVLIFPEADLLHLQRSGSYRARTVVY